MRESTDVRRVLCSGNSENQSQINIRKGGVACFEDTCAVQNSENRSDITFEGGVASNAKFNRMF